MNAKTTPFTKEQLETIIAQYPTPFHIYDAKGIMDNMRAFLDASVGHQGSNNILL